MKERIFDAFGGFGFGILVNVTKNKYFDFWCHNLALLFVITVRRHFESIYIVLVFLNSLQFSGCVVNWNRKPPLSDLPRPKERQGESHGPSG